MQKPHKYDYQVNLDSQMAPAKVIRMVGMGKRVLEIGAGPGSITRHLKTVGNCRVTALEIDSEAIKKLVPFCEQVYQADLNNPAWIDVIKYEGRFEVIVAADVLEHVYEPLAVLSAMKGFLNDDGCIIVSLPHVGHSAIHACLLQEDFEYRDWGLLDRTHIRFFGIRNMQTLFENAGLKITHAEFVVRPPEETEFAARWENVPEEIRRVLLNNPFGSVYQVVVKAIPVDSSGQAISLFSIPVNEPPGGLTSNASVKERLKRVVRKLFSASARVALRRIVLRMGINL